MRHSFFPGLLYNVYIESRWQLLTKNNRPTVSPDECSECVPDVVYDRGGGTGAGACTAEGDDWVAAAGACSGTGDW